MNVTADARKIFPDPSKIIRIILDECIDICTKKGKSDKHTRGQKRAEKSEKKKTCSNSLRSQTTI